MLLPSFLRLALALTECQSSHIGSNMPTYEYGCPDCGHQWEEIQRITAAATEKCPKCSKTSAHRLISGGTNFILKGGGWYSDLYSSAKSAGNKPAETGGGSSDSGAKTEAKTETKAETKTETKAESKPSSPPTSSS
jgi:putative FmdB family regulatory protein